MRNILGLLIIFTIASSNISFRFGQCQTTINVLDYGAAGDGKTDDSQAFLKAWNASCSINASAEGTPTLLIPAEKTFLLQPIVFSCSNNSCNCSNGIQVEILGKLVAPENPDEWKGCVDHWLSFTEMTNLILNGTGEINGQGSLWWSNITTLSDQVIIQVNNVTCPRPKALHFSRCDNLQISGLTHVDSPKGHISITQSNNVTLSNLHILAPQDSPNTDGVDISVSTHVNIRDSIIATGDDCIAINNGSSFISIINIACGPGHGISVGSLGVNQSYQTAEHIHVQNCSFNGTQNGARIKTWQGGSGYARNITFEQITLLDAHHPIIIDQHYCNGRHDCHNLTQAVQVSDITYSDFQGTSSSMQAIVFNCTETPGCTNIVMKQINITSADAYQGISASCINANGTFNSTVPQVSCLKTNGTISYNLYTETL